jgi:DNA recombination protein RmuC
LIALLLRQRKNPDLSQDKEQFLLAQFENLSRSILDKQQADLKEVAKYERERVKSDEEARRKEFDLLVKPLTDNLVKVESKLQSLETLSGGLKQQLEDYRDLGKELNVQTTDLKNALSRPEGRGRWGEMQLRRLVEIAGMVDYVDFDVQQSFDSDSGLKRPDMVVKLSQGGQIAVDSKVPLEAYLHAVTLQESERDEEFKRVAKHIKTHIKQLSEKEYWQDLDNSANFTVLFIPIEGAFQEAVRIDAEIIEYAANQKIAIATPFTLLGLLHTIARLESQFKIYREMDSYMKEVSTLHQRARKFVDYLNKAHTSAQASVDSIDKAVRSFNSRLMISIERVNSLAIVKEAKEIDGEALLEIPAPDYDEDEI